MEELRDPEDMAEILTNDRDWKREQYSFCQPYVSGKKVLDFQYSLVQRNTYLSDYSQIVHASSGPTAYFDNDKPAQNSAVVVSDVHAFPFPKDSFDLLICIDSLQYAYRSSAVRYIEEAQRLLPEEGLLIVILPVIQPEKNSEKLSYLYFYSEKEVLAILESRFRTEHYETVTGPGGKEVRWVGRCVKSYRSESKPAQREGYFEKLIGATNPIAEMGEHGFPFSHSSKTDLLSACYSLLVFEGLGKPRKFSEGIHKMAESIQDAQDKSSGYFYDPLQNQTPLPLVDGSAELQLQRTCFAIQALDVLGLRPRYPLNFLRNHSLKSITTWLEELSWNNPQSASRQIKYLFTCLVFQAEVEQSSLATRQYFQILDWLRQNQDTKTGIWGSDRGASTPMGLAAATHFIPYYEYVRQPIQSMTRIVDTALCHQQPEGCFDPGPGDGLFEESDVVGLLATITQRNAYRRKDIKRALVRCFWAIYDELNQDEYIGYSENPPPEMSTQSVEQVLMVKPAHRESRDLYGRLTAMAIIQSLYPDDLPWLGRWTFRRWPAAGYFRSMGGQTAQGGEKLAVWAFGDLPDWKNQPAGSGTVISIIIPYFNMGVYLPETLKSILNQETQYSFEIIVVDDGSNDEHSRLLLDHLHHPMVRLIRQENRGLAAARNTGISEAQGRYICCIDADDKYQQDFLEKAVTVLERQLEAGMVTSYYKLFDEQHDLIAMPTCKFPELLVENRAMVSAMFRREAWKKTGGYDESLPAMQDWDFWIAILENGYKAVVIPEVLFYYRVRPGSMYQTTRRPERFSKIYRKITEKHKDVILAMFSEYTIEVGKKFAELSSSIDYIRTHTGWLEQQKTVMNIEISKSEKTIQELQGQVSEIEKGKSWLERQSAAWEEAAVKGANDYAEVKALLQELQTRNEYLEQRIKQLEPEGESNKFRDK